jgi:hypothetical protein
MHRNSVNTLMCGVLVAVVVAGCGESSSQPSIIDFKSPAVQANGIIRPDVKCGAGSLWLPLEWGSVPADTKELAVYIGRFKYEKTATGRKLLVPFADLISRIRPSVHRIPANTLPDGVSWSAFGPNSCPPKREGQNILQELFALDRTKSTRELDNRLAIKLTEEALHAGRPGASRPAPGELMQDAVGIGRFTTTYGSP